MTPAPAMVHQRAVLRLLMLLTPYVDSIGLDIMGAPAAVTFSARREVQPDILVMPKLGAKFAKTFKDVGELTLAAEVLSPSTERVDRYKKRALYQDEHVPEYWIVDTDARVIERWRPGSTAPEILSTTFLWKPLLLREAMMINLQHYFRTVHGD